ncbi:MAG: hypothetical protein Q7U34_15125 [Anaerolineales bacterium]|nr:hypothetical protein [Anaerolineales bacterium]
MIPDANERYFCENWEAGKLVMWPGDCSSLPIKGCRKLCEHEKTIFVAEKINITNALIVPTDVSKIDYPNFYKKPATANITIEYPYCAITKETVAYPVRYLGDHELPRVDGAPLPAGITRIIGIKDFWSSEPNLNRGCRSIGHAAMKEAYEKTLQRVKSLGAEKITFTNYVFFSNFKNAEIGGPEVPEGDLRFAVTKAREQNLEVILYLNIGSYLNIGGPSMETVSDIPSASWLSTLIHNWEPFVLDQAKIAEETKVYAIMLNHFDYQPNIKGFEDTFQNGMLALLKKIRNVYSGKVFLMIEPLWGADLSKLDTLLNQVDGFIYTPPTSILYESDDKTVSVSHLKTLYLNNFADLGRDFGKYNKLIYFRVLIQSSEEFLEKGWNEDVGCIARGDDPCYQKNLEVDFSAQAVAYEAMMEAIKQTHNNYFTVGGVDSYGYWFTDVILPDVSQPQIAQSVRNKPAESIVYEWFKR